MLRNLVVLVVVACGASVVVAQETSAELAGQARRVLKQYCAGCHSGLGSKGGDFNVLLQSDLLLEGGGGHYVTPGNPSESYLYSRVFDRDMPPRALSDAQKPSDEEIAILEKWIAEGAQPFPDETASRNFITLEEVLGAVNGYLSQVPNDDQPFQRFFTLHQLYNNPVVSDDELVLHRAALSKAMNSLHYKPRIVLPKPIDPQNTVFVIDERELGWDQTSAWNLILQQYPYGLGYRNLPNQQPGELFKSICDDSQCDLPIIRADWFIATATRPPLYHTLLNIPKSAKELEARFNVNIAGGFRQPIPERIARAGFPKSGVSKQNRLIERNESSLGFYWKSYDFKPDTPKMRLTRYPLGPLNLFPEGQHPFPKLAFAHDGGEIIFSLPNGLQGYMLIKGNDERIDEGPIDVVNDSQETSGTPVIVNGISCMACHVHGMRDEFKDFLRNGAAVFGPAEEHVRRLHPEDQVMQALVAQDTNRFMQALTQAIGPYAGGKPVDQLKEPVFQVAFQHRQVYLNLKTIACELEIEDPQSIVARVGQRKLKALGLESLMTQNGVVARLEWEASDGVSLMQELARELRYTPIDIQ